MAFNPLQNFVQGQQAGQGQKANRLSGALAGQMGQGQDISRTPDFQELVSLDPKRADGLLGTFQKIDEGRKKS